jgi:hypothetical protein
MQVSCEIYLCSLIIQYILYLIWRFIDPSMATCRKGYIVVNRGPLAVNEETGQEEFDRDTCFRGRVIDRVYPGGK